MSIIRSSLHDRQLHIVFDDPTTRNSFSLKAAAELESAWQAHEGSYDSLVFRAVGRVFCSGGNLADYAAMSTPDQGKAVNRRITSVLDQLARLPVPTVCAVNGDCFGGGVELLSAFDVVIASPHVVFGLWQRRIGLSFGWGGGARLEDRLGRGRLKQLALSTESFGARAALADGLIDAIVPASNLEKAAIEAARSRSALPKAPIDGLKSWTPDQEAQLFETLWWNEEHRAVLQSRRTPRK